ncbi:ankyrin repeats (3 copies) domain-containing protein [Ditylenchus destructor]|nr:ankyrin repeats (3 copies) domain-containing protein [Ditylenchus destructor]
MTPLPPGIPSNGRSTNSTPRTEPRVGHGMLARALGHVDSFAWDDLPRAVVTFPMLTTQNGHNRNDSLPTVPGSTSNIPEELAARQRQGILSTALRQFSRSKSLNGLKDAVPGGSAPGTSRGTGAALKTSKSMAMIIDSSDEEHRTGILGKSLSKRRKMRNLSDHGRKGSLSDDEYGKIDDSSAPTSGSQGTGKRSRLVRHPRVSSPSEVELHGVNGYARQRSLQQPTDASERRRNLFKAKTDSNQQSSEEEEVEELTEAQKTELEELEELCKTGGDHSTRLLYLAKKGQWDSVRHFLLSSKRFDYTLTDQEGFTPLLLAVKAAKVDILETMLEKGADLYAITKDRMTAVHVCARWANDHMLRKLVDKRLDLAKPAGALGRWPIHQACERTSSRAYALIQTLLHNSRTSRLAVDKSKNMPIHLAIRVENIPVVQMLLQRESEAQVRTPDEDGNTPLHLAAQRSNEILRIIVESGGGEDVNTQNKLGRTPLHEVAQNGDEKMLKTIWKLNGDANIMDKEEKTPLHVAAERGHTHVVETLIDKFGSSIRARTRDGSTLLHIAASTGHADTALAFLKRGVPLYMPNKKGALGLHSAAAAGHNEVVKMLISRGTKVDIPTKDNCTALHVAVQSGQASVVETLLGYGANVHVRGGQIGETALHVAALSKSDIECAQMLLKSGAQPNVKQSDGQTPLHIASRSGNVDMIRLMLSEGADPQIKANNGETPLHVAAKNCHFGVVELILQNLSQMTDPPDVKAYVNSLTEDGETSIHYASQVLTSQAHFKDEDAKLMSILLDFGGEPERQTFTNNETAMHMCANSGNEAVLLAMVNKIGPGLTTIVQNKKSKGGWSPLLEACARGHVGVAQILLLHHARIDVFDDSGRTALHLAAANGHVQLTQLLLQNKAFVNSKTKSGEAPLHLAAMNGHMKVVNLLVQAYQASLEAITLDNQTALHFAAKHGQLAVCQAMLNLGANPNARDDKGQTPLHLAAENDYPDVVKLFLKMKQNNRAVLTAVDHNGFTCAHIAAMKGSLAVVKELMMIDKVMVIQAKTKTMEATTLHMAAAGGHAKVVKILLENGANAEDENAFGMSALHLGAKNGHVSILDCFDTSYWRRCSRKTGLNAMHIAAFHGKSDFVIEMLKHVPASVRSEPPIFNHFVVKEFSTEYGLTPLHLAAQSGHDGLVRMLINQGVSVETTSTTMNVIPLHLAAQQGHIAVVGMLLSRSTQQQHLKDWRGRTPLHLAAMNGRLDMVSLLIAQGSNINVMDQNGWTGMHYATKAGHTEVVKLFVNSSADAQAETKEGKVPLCFAAANNHIECLRFLLKQKHDTHQLMEDRKFIFDLMVCGKGNDNEPLQEFILQSPAPIDTAVKLSSLYREMSEKEKERAKDLSNVATFAENMAVELLSIAAAEYNAALLLKAKDHRGRPLLDVLIENEQKEVVSYASVQRYLTEIWTGRVDWSFGKTLAFALFVLICPPAWFYFSLPLDSRIGRAPIIKFVCHIVSHVYFTILLTVVVLNITHKMYEVTSVIPNPVEWVLLLWLSGNLVSELSNVGGGSGLAIVKVLILILAALAIAVHILAFLLPAIYLTHLDSDEKLHFARTMLYLKNQLLAFGLLFAFVEFLDFLTVHHLFGPWAIIIRDLMYDLTRFLVILMLFVAGFTLHVTSIFQPAYQPIDEDSAELMRLASPGQTLEMLFFSLFGLVEPDNMPPLHLVPNFAKIVLKLLFGIYMMVTLIVLINLLIAMMSDTYQRIQAQSDKEWKFGRAILIRQMNKRSATPSPINMLTKLFIVVKVAYRNRLRVCTQKAQLDLRKEENIDAFSMNGQQGRQSPTFGKIGNEDNEINSEEAGNANNSLDSVIKWKEIVNMYYQMTGKKNPNKEEEEENSTTTNKV